jgi:hypothetical protein
MFLIKGKNVCAGCWDLSLGSAAWLAKNLNCIYYQEPTVTSLRVILIRNKQIHITSGYASGLKLALLTVGYKEHKNRVFKSR